MDEKSAPSRKKLPLVPIGILLVAILGIYFGSYVVIVERAGHISLSRPGWRYVAAEYSLRKFGVDFSSATVPRMLSVLFTPAHLFDRHLLRRRFWLMEEP